MMGILGGLLVQAVKTVTEVEKTETTMENLFESLDAIWELAIALDADNDELLTLAEFDDIINDDATAQYLKSAEVDLDSLRECSGFIFDQCGTDGLLSKAHFMQCIMG